MTGRNERREMPGPSLPRYTPVPSRASVASGASQEHAASLLAGLARIHEVDVGEGMPATVFVTRRSRDAPR